MAPPKTTLAIGQQQQQPFLNGQQSPQANKSQPARSVRNRKAKQAQPHQQPNNTINNPNPIQKTQRDVAEDRAQNGATKQTGNGQTQLDNLGQQKQQVEPNNKIQQPLNTSASAANTNANATTNGAKTHSPIKVNNSGAANSPAPSERTTIKQRKEAAAAAAVAAVTVTQSTLDNHNQKVDKQQNSSDKTTQRFTAPNNNSKKNLISMSHEKQQQAQSTLSSQTSNNVVAAAAAALSVAKNNNNNASVLMNKHQISSLVDDDIDAGIELDGSSNSGSSVKDANEDQMKSNSVSPVMLSAQPTPFPATAETLVVTAAPVAQETTTTVTSNPITATTVSGESILDSVNEPQASSGFKRTSGASPLVAIEPIQTAIATSVAIEDVTATTTPTTSSPAPAKATNSCSVASSADAIGSSSPINLSPKNGKKTTMTRDELAKERQSIEADEQLIQERLESKQRKSSGASTCSLATANGSDATCDSGATNQDNVILRNNKSATTNGETNDNKLADQSDESINLLKNDGNNNKSSGAARIKRQFSADMSASALQVAATNGGLKSLCKNCGSHVYQMERMLAEKSLYHKQCFRCFQCKMQLRIDNYASHEGQVYCKLHHKQIFQPQVKLNAETDADSVAKSTTKQVDEYLLQRGRLSELTFSFLNITTEGSRQKQMIICENEPVELSKDVVRSDTKVDDGINTIKLNLSNILQRFESGSASNVNETDKENGPSSASTIVIEKPRFNIKQKLAAFENNQVMPQDDSSSDEQQQPTDKANSNYTNDKPVVGKLGDVASLFSKFNNSQDDEANKQQPNNVTRKVSVKRSESIMGRLKKYESRIAGEHVEDDDSTSSGDEASGQNNTKPSTVVKTVPRKINIKQFERNIDSESSLQQQQHFKVKKNVPKLGSLDLSSLKNRWENGDIKNISHYDDDDDNDYNNQKNHGQKKNINNYSSSNNNNNNNLNNNNNNINVGDKFNNTTNGVEEGDDKSSNSPMAEKREELLLIRQQLAQRRGSGKSGSVRNIYENALREAEELQKNQLASSRRDSSDLNALNKLSTSEIQQQLLQQKQQQQEQQPTNNNINNDNFSSSQQTTNNKDHFQLNISRRANKLKERFELGLINNNSRDDNDSEASDSEESPALTKLEKIRQEKMEDLSVFTDGEIKAREARTLFQQIDRRLSSSSSIQQQLTPTTPTRSFVNLPRSSNSTAPATPSAVAPPTSVGS